MGDFDIRVMKKSDLAMAISWANVEGWNPGVNDLEPFYEADNCGFFMGFLDGIPISCISAVKYSSDFAFIGFYIVKAEFRGMGYGRRTWDHAMRRVAICNVGLDAVPEQEAKYAASGFCAAHRTHRFRGVFTSISEVDQSHAHELRDVGPEDFESLLRYDRTAFPADRPAFLRAWIRQPATTALICTRDGLLCGYGVIRRAQDGFRIGPLFADDADTADALLRALGSRAAAADAGPVNVFMDVPEHNLDAVALAERRGMARSFATARMYTGGPPAPAGLLPARVFGLTSLELG
jgi:ribosomal protein S18 acetylase RimI-like enzyme